MSASNWSICPRCYKRAQAEKAKAAEHAAKAYGKVPAEEYLELRKLAEGPVVLDNTLREKYFQVVGEVDGKYEVSYSAECQISRCGYTFNYRHEEQTKV